jgi:hypothetical protein
MWHACLCCCLTVCVFVCVLCVLFCALCCRCYGGRLTLLLNCGVFIACLLAHSIECREGGFMCVVRSCGFCQQCRCYASQARLVCVREMLFCMVERDARVHCNSAQQAPIKPCRESTNSSSCKRQLTALAGCSDCIIAIGTAAGALQREEWCVHVCLLYNAARCALSVACCLLACRQGIACVLCHALLCVWSFPLVELYCSPPGLELMDCSAVHTTEQFALSVAVRCTRPVILEFACGCSCT